MNRRCLGLASCALVVALVGSVSADDGGSWSSWNPFAAKPSTSKSKPPTRKISDSKSSGWSLNPFAAKPTNSSSNATKSASSRRKPEPGMLTKTWEAITPWDDHPPKKPAPLVDPKTVKTNKKKEKGWFDSWFEEEEPKRPRTVNEWLDQEKPQF